MKITNSQLLQCKQELEGFSCSCLKKKKETKKKTNNDETTKNVRSSLSACLHTIFTLLLLNNCLHMRVIILIGSVALWVQTYLCVYTNVNVNMNISVLTAMEPDCIPTVVENYY